MKILNLSDVLSIALLLPAMALAENKDFKDADADADANVNGGGFLI